MILKNKINRLLFYSFVLHYFAYVIMQTLAFHAEFRRGPALPDLILDTIPINRNYIWMNHHVWFVGLISFLVFMAFRRKTECIIYLRVGAVVSILRGVFISLTTLGPPRGEKISQTEFLLNYDITLELLLNQWIPIAALWGEKNNAFYLTQDLFFSGHTSSTFLLVLVLRKYSKEFFIAILFHLSTIFFLLLSHEHYSIDILGAYFVVYSVYIFMEKRNYFLSAEVFKQF